MGMRRVLDGIWGGGEGIGGAYAAGVHKDEIATSGVQSAWSRQLRPRTFSRSKTGKRGGGGGGIPEDIIVARVVHAQRILPPHQPWPRPAPLFRPRGRTLPPATTGTYALPCRP